MSGLTDDFLKAHRVVKPLEGGYVKDPDDLGGETYKGIARNIWRIPMWDHIDIKHKGKPNFPECMEDDEGLQLMVKEFYKREFWDKLKLDAIPSSQFALKLELYDTSINQGAGTGAKFFQRAINLCNNGGKDYPNIVADSRIGKKTIDAFMACKQKPLIHTLCNLMQGHRYIEITEARLKNERFYNGWLERRVVIPASNKLRSFMNNKFENKLKAFNGTVALGGYALEKFFQRALNLSNRNGKTYADIKVDGAIGPATQKAFEACKNKEVVFMTILILQGERVINMAEYTESNEVHLSTWIDQMLKG